MKLKAIAAELGIHPYWLWRRVRRGEIPGVAWRQTGPGRTGRVYTEDEANLIRAWFVGTRPAAKAKAAKRAAEAAKRAKEAASEARAARKALERLRAAGA
jgi:hypothetical protein